jgi:hypothetical protein
MEFAQTGFAASTGTLGQFGTSRSVIPRSSTGGQKIAEDGWRASAMESDRAALL